MNKAEIQKGIESGRLCYICGQNPPTLIDEVGGRICKACNDAVNAMRLMYALAGGYHRRRGPDQAGNTNEVQP